MQGPNKIPRGPGRFVYQQLIQFSAADLQCCTNRLKSKDIFHLLENIRLLSFQLTMLGVTSSKIAARKILDGDRTILARAITLGSIMVM